MYYRRCYSVAYLEDRSYNRLAPIGGFAFIAGWASLLFWNSRYKGRQLVNAHDCLLIHNVRSTKTGIISHYDWDSMLYFLFYHYMSALPVYLVRWMWCILVLFITLRPYIMIVPFLPKDVPNMCILHPLSKLCVIFLCSCQKNSPSIIFTMNGRIRVVAGVFVISTNLYFLNSIYKL